MHGYFQVMLLYVLLSQSSTKKNLPGFYALEVFEKKQGGLKGALCVMFVAYAEALLP